MELQIYKLDCHPGLVATRCNCFSVSSTFKFHTEINQHQISKQSERRSVGYIRWWLW